MKTRKVKPVTGTVRWLKTWSGRWGRISITNQNGTTTEYDVDDREDDDGNTIGYGLATDDDTSCRGEMDSAEGRRSDDSRIGSKRLAKTSIRGMLIAD